MNTPILNNPFIEMDALHGPAHRPDHPDYPSEQYVFLFRNGYGASVIRNAFISYGGREGKYELAVLSHNGIDVWYITYETPITNNVIGWLTVPEVRALLEQIARLS